MEELWEFQSAFHDCLARSEPRAHCFDSMVGQCSQLERKSIEPMALQVDGGTIRGLQRFLSDVGWDEEQMLWNDHQLVAEEMGEPDGILMFDETGLVKKGKDSVGVARQYCGTLGKVEHGQVGVFAGYASRQGYALVDKRFFLPEGWLTETYAARRSGGGVPPAVTLQSKPQLAAAMLQAIVRAGLLPCTYVVADCLYGKSPDCLDAVEACGGVTTFVAMPSETRCWLQRPRTEDKTDISTGDARSKRMVVNPAHAPRTVATVAANLPASCGSQRKVSEGTQGPMVSACARQRVTRCKEGLPERTVWLVLKRTLGGEPTYAYSISHAPASPPLGPFVWLSGLRWAVEQCCEEGKTALGMAHDAVRKYPGWHHHRLTTRLGHFLLWHLKLRLGKKSSGTDGVATAEILGGRLAPADGYHCRRVGVHRVGPTAQSPGVSSASRAATRGWMRLWMERLVLME